MGISSGRIGREGSTAGGWGGMLRCLTSGGAGQGGEAYAAIEKILNPLVTEYNMQFYVRARESYCRELAHRAHQVRHQTLLLLSVP
mmetsp:Transcript_39021/g.124203  ORF Transcript_39021/g.124203 Transcript_39021/m.124203 type:complete len:86 (+) Transcript_39021:148-405(+)